MPPSWQERSSAELMAPGLYVEFDRGLASSYMHASTRHRQAVDVYSGHSLASYAVAASICGPFMACPGRQRGVGDVRVLASKSTSYTSTDRHIVNSGHELASML